jgi:hypothetical protein
MGGVGGMGVLGGIIKGRLYIYICIYRGRGRLGRRRSRE